MFEWTNGDKMKYFLRWILTGTLLLAGCQTLQVNIEFPQEETATPADPAPVPVKTSSPVPTALPSPNAPFDPYPYLLTFDDLPTELSFSGGDLQIFAVSYLQSDGNILGTAYSRGYSSYPENIFINQIIFQSPQPFQPGSLRTGHFGRDFVMASAEETLGQAAAIYQFEDKVSYRFYQNNLMVSVDMAGDDELVSVETVRDLAEKIHARLPESLPTPQKLQMPSTALDEALFKTYFRSIELARCDGDRPATDFFDDGDMGFCFRADILEYIPNLKVGIYTESYEQLIYLQEFQSSPTIGEWTTGLFFPVWGYGWQHLREGQYRALFWVDDELVASLPFQYIPK